MQTSGQQAERTVHPGVVAERSQRELRVLAGVEHVRAEMALDAAQQVVARAGHAAAEDDALRVADAAGVCQCLAQIVEHLLKRFDREGVAAAGGTTEHADAAQRYADALGLAFQIRDDMLDVIGDEATFGKPIGSDKAEKKTTFVDLLGLAACEREVVRLTDEAISALGLFGGEADFLAALSHSMETRNK